jgi:predicted negative regulator of RcsB-dependent stress response
MNGIWIIILMVLGVLLIIGFFAYRSRPQRINSYRMYSFAIDVDNDEEREFMFRAVRKLNNKNHIVKIHQSKEADNTLVIKTRHPYAAYVLGYVLADFQRNYNQLTNYIYRSN